MDIVTYAIAVGKARKLIDEHLAHLPIATREKLGAVIIGENLNVTNQGIVSVDTASTMSEFDDRPITAAAVFAVVGDIEQALAAI